MLEKVMQKLWKSGPKCKMGSKIAQKSIQKSIKKSMWKSMPFKEISKMVKSPKLPTIQQDYLQVVYLNITYLNKNQTIWETTD